MKKTTLNKLLAVFMAAAMLVCVLAGCGAKETPATTEAVVQDNAAPAGMLVLATEAAIKITYDSNAMVTELEGFNDYGIILVDEYGDYEGKSCVDVAKDMINASANAGNLSPRIKNVVLKLAIGSSLPTEDFLANVESAVQSALDTNGSVSKLVVIDTAGLDEEGYINLEFAKTLLMNHLGVEKLDAYYGSTSTTNGQYICTVEAGGEESSWTIDAVTGLISEATEEELLTDPEVTETFTDYDYSAEEEAAAGESEYIEEEAPTDAVVEEPSIETEPVIEE